MSWWLVAALAITAYSFKAVGLIVLGRRTFTGPAELMTELVPVALLSALVVPVQTFSDGRSLGLDARAVGLGGGGDRGVAAGAVRGGGRGGRRGNGRNVGHRFLNHPPNPRGQTLRKRLRRVMPEPIAPVKVPPITKTTPIAIQRSLERTNGSGSTARRRSG